MLLDNIDDSELLYRMVKKSDPDGFINGEPTPALFIDPKGLSVDRDGERDESDIIESFRNRFDKNGGYGRAVKITAAKCRDIGTYPNPINNKKNKYHAEIHESEEIVEISLIKAMKLASACTVVAQQPEQT